MMGGARMMRVQAGRQQERETGRKDAQSDPAAAVRQHPQQLTCLPLAVLSLESDTAMIAE